MRTLNDNDPMPMRFERPPEVIPAPPEPEPMRWIYDHRIRAQDLKSDHMPPLVRAVLDNQADKKYQLSETTAYHGIYYGLFF